MTSLEPLAPAPPSRFVEPLRRLALSLGLASLLVGLFAAIASSDAAATLRAFYLSPFRSSVMVSAMAEAAAYLAVAALGVLVAYRSGHFSLGGEGQVYAGAVAAAFAGALASPGLGGLFIALAFGALAGAAVGAPSALGRRFAGADVLLTSFLVSQASILAADWLIAGPWRDPANNLVAMRAVPRASLLPRLAPPGPLTPAPLVAAALCAIAWFYFSKTRQGKALSLYGKNRTFAGLMGYPVKAFSWLPILAGGALHGLAGAFMALGSNGTAVRGISGGVGWSAIGVCLIAGNEPAALPFAALLFAWLDAGARQAAIISDLPPDAATVIKALVIMAATARPLLTRLRAGGQR